MELQITLNFSNEPKRKLQHIVAYIVERTINEQLHQFNSPTPDYLQIFPTTYIIAFLQREALLFRIFLSFLHILQFIKVSEEDSEKC